MIPKGADSVYRLVRVFYEFRFTHCKFPPRQKVHKKIYRMSRDPGAPFNEQCVRRVFDTVLRTFDHAGPAFAANRERVDNAIASGDANRVRNTMSVLLSKTPLDRSRTMALLEAALDPPCNARSRGDPVRARVTHHFAAENARLAEAVRIQRGENELTKHRMQMLEADVMENLARANADVSEMIVSKSRCMSEILKDVARMDKCGMRQVLDLMWVVDMLESSKSEAVVDQRQEICMKAVTISEMPWSGAPWRAKGGLS